MIIDFSDWLSGVEPDQAKSKETMQFGRITLTEAEFDRYREDYPRVNVPKKLQQLAKWLDRLPIF
jgi:hypothetical protein